MVNGETFLGLFSVTGDPGSKPDQRKCLAEIKAIYIRKIKYKSRTLSNKNSKLVRYLVHWECADCKVVGINTLRRGGVI